MYFDRNIDLLEKISMAKKKCGQSLVVLHPKMNRTLVILTYFDFDKFLRTAQKVVKTTAWQLNGNK